MEEQDEREQDEKKQDEEERFSRWRRVGYRHAAQTGLSHEDCEDCAAEFLIQMLSEERKAPSAVLVITHVCAWEHTCAHHFALNYRRRESKYEHACDWQKLAGVETADVCLACSCQAESPLDIAARHEFAQHLSLLLVCLPDSQQALFRRHHLQGETVPELARALQKTPGAIEQTLWRARQTLRKRMQEQEWIDPE